MTSPVNNTPCSGAITEIGMSRKRITSGSTVRRIAPRTGPRTVAAPPTTTIVNNVAEEKMPNCSGVRNWK